MLDPSLVEALADGAIADAPVERGGAHLSVAPDRAQAGFDGQLVQAVHQRGADAAPARRREHRDPADLAAVAHVEPARADRRAAIVVGEEVQAQRIALVELDVLGNALLVDEDREPHAAYRGVIRLEARALDAHSADPVSR